MSLESAFKLVEKKEKEAIELLRALLAIDTTAPPGRNYEKMVDLLEPKFLELEFKTERVIVPQEKMELFPLKMEGPRPNLVASKSFGKEAVTIYAHMDTVPIEEAWTVDPFAGVVKDGKIYGRGVSDMKGTIASLITALQVIEELGMEPRFDLNCVMCTDEEVGIYPGVLHLALNGYVKGHILCMEGSQEPRIGLSANGSVGIVITTTGRSCHSGMNFLGINALEEMIPLINELMELKKEVEGRRSSIPWPPRLPNAPSEKVSPMFNLDIIQGGTAPNIVPAKCTLTVNRRYIYEEKYEDVVREVKEAVERGRRKSRALDVDAKFYHAYPPYKPDTKSWYAKRMMEAYKLVQGYKDSYFVRGGEGGSTDMAYISQILKTDKFVSCGIGRHLESRAHGADENIRISDFLAHMKELIYYLTA